MDRIVGAAAGSAEVTSRMAERAQEQQARMAGLRDEIAAVSRLAAENGEGATQVTEAAPGTVATAGGEEVGCRAPKRRASAQYTKNERDPAAA